jgi:hypothetical protein
VLELFILTMLAGWCLLSVVLGLSTSRVRHVMSGPAAAALPAVTPVRPGGHARTDRLSWLTTKQDREAEVQGSLGM